VVVVEPKRGELIGMTTSERGADVLDAVRAAVDGTTAGRVFGTPVSGDGVVLLPVARIAGGGGGTGPAAEDGRSEGTGGGFGTSGLAGMHDVDDDPPSSRTCSPS
jgi:hypothetical protein